MKVLYVASNPIDASNLNLEREITAFRRNAVANSGEAVDFIFLPNLPFEDLPAELSKNKPDILHISAHGMNEGLSLAHEDRERVLLTAEMLCAFLDIDPAPKLVYLNSCDSKALAKQLTQRVPMAIGFDAPITNRAARQAALTFYIRLLEGQSIKRAYEASRMIMKGLDQNSVSSQLFSQDGVDPARWVLHVPTRIVARFWEDKTRPSGKNYLVEIGLSGCPRNTSQVVFFTDDDEYINSDDALEDDLCSVVRTTPERGDIWIEYEWKTYGNLRLFACGVTAGGDHFSASNDLCSALESYYVETRGVSKIGDLPAFLQNAITSLRNMGRK